MEESLIPRQIDKIIKIKKKILNQKEKIYVLIKWKDFEKKHNSWEPIENLNFKSALFSLKELQKNLKKENNNNSLILINKAIKIWEQKNNPLSNNNFEVLKEGNLSNTSSITKIDVFSISDFFENEKKDFSFENENTKVVFKDIIFKNEKFLVEKDNFDKDEDLKNFVKRQKGIYKEYEICNRNNKLDFIKFFIDKMSELDRKVKNLEKEFNQFIISKKKN